MHGLRLPLNPGPPAPCQFGRRKRACAPEIKGSLSILRSKAWGGVSSGAEIMLSAAKLTGAGPTAGQSHALGTRFGTATLHGRSRLRL